MHRWGIGVEMIVADSLLIVGLPSTTVIASDEVWNPWLRVELFDVTDGFGCTFLQFATILLKWIVHRLLTLADGANFELARFKDLLALVSRRIEPIMQVLIDEAVMAFHLINIVTIL